MGAALPHTEILQPAWAIDGRTGYSHSRTARRTLYRGSAEPVRGRGDLRAQLRFARICAVPAFRDLLLSGHRFRHRARSEARRGGRTGRTQASTRLYAGAHLFRTSYRPSGTEPGGGRISGPRARSGGRADRVACGIWAFQEKFLIFKGEPWPTIPTMFLRKSCARNCLA